MVRFASRAREAEDRGDGAARPGIAGRIPVGFRGKNDCESFVVLGKCVVARVSSSKMRTGDSHNLSITHVPPGVVRFRSDRDLRGAGVCTTA